MNSQQTQTPPAPSKKTGGNSTVIIIIVIVAAILILGVGGYFGWKYVSKNYLKSKADVSTTPKSTGFTLSQLEEMIKYPNGTLTSTDHSKAAGYTSVLQMETDDSVATANNYYLSLNANQKWTVTAKSLESDNSRADITYAGTSNKFTVNFVIDHNYEKTSVYVKIDAEDLPVGTPLSTSPTASSSITTPKTTPTPTTSVSTDTTKKTISNDYIIADSNSRLISESEISNFTPWELKVARNEIYARYGRPFVHKDLQCYFAGKSWYEKDDNFTESILSTIENKNVATIQSYEQKISSPLASKDSGC